MFVISVHLLELFNKLILGRFLVSLYSSLYDIFHDVGFLGISFHEQWLRGLTLCLVHSRYLHLFVYQSSFLLSVTHSSAAWILISSSLRSVQHSAPYVNAGHTSVFISLIFYILVTAWSFQIMLNWSISSYLD